MVEVVVVVLVVLVVMQQGLLQPIVLQVTVE
jgi:hypothetical protein